MSVYTSDMYAFLIHIRFVRSAYYYVAALLSFVLEFMLMHSLSTQGNAGVLHVPACKHDRPALPGFTFLCTCAVYRLISLRLCLSPTRSRPVVGAGNLIFNLLYKEKRI